MDTRQILLIIGVAVYYFIRHQSKKNKTKQEYRQPEPRQEQPQHEQPQQEQPRQRSLLAPQQRPQQPMTQPQEKSLEDILRELAGEQKVKAREDRVKIKHIETDYTTKPEAISTEKLARRADTKKRASTPRIEVEEDEASVDFNLHQAIVNDAILNRPVY